jgi:hypothetical protein
MQHLMFHTCKAQDIEVYLIPDYIVKMKINEINCKIK